MGALVLTTIDKYRLCASSKPATGKRRLRLVAAPRPAGSWAGEAKVSLNSMVALDLHKGVYNPHRPRLQRCQPLPLTLTTLYGRAAGGPAWFVVDARGGHGPRPSSSGEPYVGRITIRGLPTRSNGIDVGLAGGPAGPVSRHLRLASNFMESSPGDRWVVPTHCRPSRTGSSQRTWRSLFCTFTSAACSRDRPKDHRQPGPPTCRRKDAGVVDATHALKAEAIAMKGEPA